MATIPHLYRLPAIIIIFIFTLLNFLANADLIDSKQITIENTATNFISTTTLPLLEQPQNQSTIVRRTAVTINADDLRISTTSPTLLPIFVIKKHADYPWTILQISAPAEPYRFGYFEFRANITDMSIVDSNEPVSYVAHGSTPITVYGLYAGHEYRVEMIGKPVDLSKDYRLLMTANITMDTVVPDFAGINASIDTTETSITLKAEKMSHALQDKYHIVYVRLDPYHAYPNREVSDLREQKTIEIYLGNLDPGHNYNVTVTAIRGGAVSRPWHQIVTTKPLKPENIRLTDMLSSAVTLSWTPAKNSGVDRYKVVYGVSGDNRSSIEIDAIHDTRVQLSKGLFPGKTFVFAVFAEKASQTSAAMSIERTMKPLAPIDLDINPDYVHNSYRIDVIVPSANETRADQCTVEVISEHLEKIQLIAPVLSFTDATDRLCTYLVDLEPGRRYEVFAWINSENATSNKLSNSTALEPAFSMKTFELHLHYSDANSGVELHWPNSDASISTLLHAWNRIVGNESLLQLRIDPITQPDKWKEQSKLFEGSPIYRQPIRVHNLRRGACYKMQIYTVTKSGIVSKNRSEEYVRIEPPFGNISVDEITKTTASLSIELQSNATDLPDCLLHFLAKDFAGKIVSQKSLPLVSRSIPIHLENLQSYHKYRAGAEIVCGRGDVAASSSCPVKMRAMIESRFETNEDRPGAVRNLTAIALNPYSVRLTWLEPAMPNGRILNYVINVYPQDGFEAQSTVDVPVTTMETKNESISTIVDNLTGGLSYQFDVLAVTEAGRGVSTVEDADGGSVTPPELKMPIWAPPKPHGRVEILRNTIRSTDVSVRFSSQLFDTKHGLLEKYALIVVEVPATRSSEDFVFVDDVSNQTSTWGQVQSQAIWTAYVATESPIERRKDFEPWRTITEVVGVDESCFQQSPDVICNGPLHADKAYRIKLRLFTGVDLWTDSDYSELVVTEQRSVNAVSTLVLIALCLLAAIALIVGALLLVINRNRRRNINSTTSSKSSSSVDENRRFSPLRAFTMMMAERAADCLAKLGLDNNNGHHLGPPGGDTTNISDHQLSPVGSHYGHHRRSRSLRERTGVDARLERLPSGPAAGNRVSLSPLFTIIPGVNLEQSRPVRVSDFCEHVRLMSADSDFRFSEEYEDLKQIGRSQPCIAADLPVNRAKNRFTNILPYDHSRVKLVPVDDDDGSDYINASYISGYNSRREFIAAQGPLPSTRDHFWRMIWEQQCPAVIALTKCIEKGRDKCHQYWPDNGDPSLTYADIEVTLMNEISYDEFFVREFKLTHLSEVGAVARTIRHYHYMAWPDFGVPERAAGLVHFVRVFRQKTPPHKACKPTIVHCSAGVGRSGTFIALDRLMQAIQKDDTVDTFGIVCGMRKERVCMVQTEQYIFIHHCLAFVLEGGEHDVNGYPTMTMSSSSSTATTNSLYPKPVPVPVVIAPISSFGNGWITPRIEVHQNPAFEDDEGIAESGL